MYTVFMDALQDLLASKKPNEPPQLAALRNYVRSHHDQPAATGITHLGYTLTVSTAPLASVLQMEMQQIRTECDLDKKLFIRIGVVE